MKLEFNFHYLEIQGQKTPLFFGAMQLQQFTAEKGITLGQWQDKVGNINFENVSSIGGEDTFFLCDMIHTALSLGHELSTGETFPHSKLEIRALLMQDYNLFAEALVLMVNTWGAPSEEEQKKTKTKLAKAS